ncbi:hypothetical protein BGZ60DRAFT_396910 [Tricladium varicosporioides]|nr:hypothetical protein BGZ60DRAFT_396910 [Hymenoscyphus varicosporioides]
MSAMRIAARDWVAGAPTLRTHLALDFPKISQWLHSSDLPIEYSQESSCTYFSLLHYQDSVDIDEGSLDHQTLPAWLEKTAEKNGQLPKRGLRLIVEYREFDIVKGFPISSLSHESFTRVKDWIGCPAQDASPLGRYFTPSMEFCCSSLTSVVGMNTSNPVLQLELPFHYPNKSRITIRYDRESNITYAFLITSKGDNIVKPLFDSLKNFPEFCDQPSLIAGLLLEYSIYICIFRLSGFTDSIDALEKELGQHKHPGAPSKDPLEVNFQDTTKLLNWISCRAGIDTVRIRSLKESLEKVVKWKEAALIKPDIRLQANDSPQEDTKLRRDTIIKEEEEQFLAVCDNILLEEDLIEKRCQLLIQVVYQFMSARDARTNIQIAESSATISKASKEDSAIMRTIAIETKKDSSAMKTIAILGMFFLPGTFVAAIFAMPVFNWDVSGFPKAKVGFSYYLSITIPLTCLVLTTWALAMLLPWRRILDKHLKSEKSEHRELSIELR